MDSTKSVTDKALARALDLLTALKADYVIKLPDAEPIIVGALELKPIKATKIRRRGLTAPHGTYTNYCRARGVDKMQVGDVITFTPEADGLDVQRTRGVACSLGGKIYGNDSVMTTVNRGLVEIMRVK
jgi:hypothetical protein